MKTIAVPAVAVAALTILAGCSAAAVEADPSHLPDTAPVATSTPTPIESAAEESAFGERVINDRGNLVKQVGQLAGLSSADDEDVIAAQFAVTDIVVDLDCTSDYAEDPENGHFVGIHLNVETTPELAQEDVSSLSFSAWGWQAFDADGKRVNDPIGNALWCMADGDQLPADIGPGQSVSGWVALDVPTDHGSVVLTMGADSGWEWEY